MPIKKEMMLAKTIRFFTKILFLVTVIACSPGTNKENNQNNEQTIASSKIEIEAEIDQWKQELLDQKKIGTPCDYTRFDSSAVHQWKKDNPDQIDGLPLDDEAINSTRGDFNNDSLEDLLMYFQTENCTGHNGGTETYAKIIYSNGTAKSDLVSEIRNAIQSEYQHSRKKNTNLKEVTDAYLATTTTINRYHNGITGDFRLYTETDSHCCPSYSGTYVYDVKGEKMQIKVSENEVQ